MGLFDRKYCDVCGDKIGLFGNRKLDDGNLCKECAAKLSPWFTDRRRSTVESIKEQLDYREKNKDDVAAFHTTRTLGINTKVLLDEDAEKFMVTSARDLVEANPDVMSFSQVTGCRIDIDEDKRELKREDKDGNEISYNPPRYTYYYDFSVIINVNTPYFDEISFKLGNDSVESSVQISKSGAGVRQPIGVPMGMPSMGMPMSVRAVAGVTPIEYEEREKLGEEIKEALTQVRTEVRQAAEEANAPKIAVTCPCCGATTETNTSGICEYCGGAING